MTPSICFFTVCGGGEDYEFLLGSIEHHAMMGSHLILDTSMDPRTFKNLPMTVRWIHEPIYGAGWNEFKLRTATERAMNLAKELGAEVLVYLDCDEFFSADCADWVFPLARDFMVEVKTVTWTKDGIPREFGESEWHRRIWPAKMDVEIARNEAWVNHPNYNGNPEHHPFARPKKGVITRAHGLFHHHLHYALGSKVGETETAQNTIHGWGDGGHAVPTIPWPEPLQAWKDHGVAPSSRFS